MGSSSGGAGSGDPLSELPGAEWLVDRMAKSGTPESGGFTEAGLEDLGYKEEAPLEMFARQTITKIKRKILPEDVEETAVGGGTAKTAAARARGSARARAQAGAELRAADG